MRKHGTPDILWEVQLYDVEIELTVSYGVSNMKTGDSNSGAIFCLLTNHASVYI